MFSLSIIFGKRLPVKGVAPGYFGHHIQRAGKRDLQIVLAMVAYNRLLWSGCLFLCGALCLTALATSISHFCLGTAVFCFLPITLLELKKKNHRNIVSQRLLWLELLSGILKSRQWGSKLKLEKFKKQGPLLRRRGLGLLVFFVLIKNAIFSIPENSSSKAKDKVEKHVILWHFQDHKVRMAAHLFSGICGSFSKNSSQFRGWLGFFYEAPNFWYFGPSLLCHSKRIE